MTDRHQHQAYGLDGGLPGATGMTPYEIMLSESQERMLIIVRKGREDEVKRIFDKWDLPWAEIGVVTDTGRMVVRQPLVLTGHEQTFDIMVNVTGGGESGQAGAVRHGIARALLEVDAALRPLLKADGLLTRDPRMRERKKYGQSGARRRYQFSKR